MRHPDGMPTPVCEGCAGYTVGKGHWGGGHAEWFACAVCDADEPHKCRLLHEEDPHDPY